MKVHNLLVTGSHTSSGEDIKFISSSVATINNAQNDRLNSIESITGSIVSKTGSFATTGSNLFKGTQTLSGSIIPAVDNAYDLGSVTHQFRDLYLSSASLYIDGTKVLSSTTQELQITTDAGQSFKILEAGSDTITLQSNDGNITLATSGGGDVIMDPTNGIIALKGTTTIYAGNRILSSDGNNIHFGNGVVISGSLLATGTNLISGSQQIGEFGYTTTSSVNTISSSINTRINSITGIQATTGSNNFIGTQTITGSLYISQNLIVQGSSSLQDVTGSNVYIGTNKINLNTDTPSIRFGGVSVFDSGSNFGESGSLLWDSQENHWVYQHPASSGAPYGSAMLISGPKNSGSLGSEQGLTTGKISKAVGDDHIGDSIITETGGGIGISGSLSISGSIVATGTSLWSGSGQLPSGVISGSVQVISSLPSGTISGSAQVSFTGTTGYSTYINQAVLTTSNPTFNSVISGDIRYNSTGYITYDVANSGTNSLVVRKFGTTVLTLNSSGYLGVNVDPSFYLDVQSNVANNFYTIAQFENRDYTSGTRSFIRVRNWLSAGGSYSSYFGQGQDGKTYIIANNSARGGDIVIDGGNGYVGVGRSSPAYLFDVGGGSAFRDTLRLLSNDVNTVNISWTGSNTGLINLYDGGTLRTQILATGLSFFNGSIKINQDAALRAGSTDNWLIGQDSGTNLIHIGSTAIANDVRFDSSTGSGIVIIKSNARLGVNTIDPATTFDVNGHMGLRSNNYFYFGHTTSNIGGWTTRMYADGATHKFNANGFVFNNEGYGSATWLSINSSGNATFSSTINASGSITTSQSLFSTKSIVAGEATPLHLSYASSDGIGPAVRLGSGAQGFWDIQPSSNNTRLSFEWSDTTNTLNLYSNGSVSVGSDIANVSNKLAVGGAVRANNTVYNWWQAGSNDWDGYQYLHLKTNLSSGASGNVDHTMSLFYGRLYSYSSAYIREGHYGFHNWSGALYNPVSTGNFWSGGYSSSDGFVVLVVALGGGSYIGINIDWHQSYPYGFRDRTVTTYSRSNSATGVY
jgi:hypothetical protein